MVCMCVYMFITEEEVVILLLPIVGSIIQWMASLYWFNGVCGRSVITDSVTSISILDVLQSLSVNKHVLPTLNPVMRANIM